MFFYNKLAAPRPHSIHPLLTLSDQWWRNKNCEASLVHEIGKIRYRQQDEAAGPDDFSSNFGNPPSLNSLNVRFDLSGMPWKNALQCVREAIDSEASILIYGDYDCDGICSATLIADALEEVRRKSNYTDKPDDPGKIHCFIPNRSTDKYGLTQPALERALAQCSLHPPAVFIAVDCGSPESSAGPLNYLKAQGIRTIVIDHHHTPVIDDRHPADFHLNPKGWRATANRPELCDLCAAGLAYFFAWDLAETDEFGWEGSRAAVLAGLATYADVVPLLRLNRDLVRQAILLCGADDSPAAPLRKIPGLRALHGLINHNFKKKFGRLPKIDETTFGFVWGPCLNAGGRIDDPLHSLELLRLKQRDEKKAEALAAVCFAMNNRRKYQQRKVLEEARRLALAQASNFPPAKVLLVGAKDWHKGVIGIVAARLREEFRRPAIVYTLDTVKENKDGQEPMWTASARSMAGFDLGTHLALAVTQGIIAEGGGHKMAGGLRFTERQRPGLHRWLNRLFEDQKLNETWKRFFFRRAEVVARLEDLTLKQWFRVMKLLRPFGQANPGMSIYLENAWLEKVAFFKFQRVNRQTAENQTALEPAVNQLEVSEEEYYRAVEKDPGEFRPDETGFATGSFQSKHRVSGLRRNGPASNYTIYWKDLKRVRLEWRERRRYTLELEVTLTRKGDYRLVLVNCWPEGDGQEFPPYVPPASQNDSSRKHHLVPTEMPFAWRMEDLRPQNLDRSERDGFLPSCEP
jgi:single-stranded DNA-specific DHH superfamily exonuclease